MASNQAMPNNLQAERAVLGACLLSIDELGRVSEILKPEDFYDANNKIAYETCLDMYLENKPIDIVTFANEAQSKGQLERLGGQPFIAELVNDVTATANAFYHAQLVKHAALRRRLIDAGNKIAALATNDDVAKSDLMSEAEKILLEVSTEKESAGPVSMKDSTSRVLMEIQELKAGRRKNAGVASKFTALDKYIPTFKPGSLNIIAARPSMGKTALAMNIAQFGGAVEDNKPVLVFSLEMSADDLINRMLSAQSLESGEGVKLSDMTAGTLSDYDFYTVKRAAEKLQARNIFIYDQSELTAMDFRTKCRRFKTRHPDLSLIVVDYIQLMSMGTNRHSDSRQFEVAEISRVMKSVAVELQCPIIALSQLSRNTEKRTEKKPQLADLRDSGAIEQDADTVILLFREDYYSDDENNDLTDSKADIRIAKNRNGSTGTCHLTFRREYTRFTNYGGDN